MRHHVLAAAILCRAATAYAEYEVTLHSVTIQAERPSGSDTVVTVENTQAQARTLGGMLEQVPGLQSSAFGPNAGAPVIRSLSGSRGQLLEDVQSILGMNALIGDINIESGEYLGAAEANQYQFDSNQRKVLLAHRRAG